MKASKNFTLLLIVLSGYMLLAFRPFICSWSLVQIPPILIASCFYLAFSLFYRKLDFTIFVLFSLLFISCFFSFMAYRSIGLSQIWASWLEPSNALSLYTYLLLPFIFISFTADFYTLPNEFAKFGNNKFFHFFIPILIKRELILHRFKKIIEAFQARGFNTQSFFSRYFLLPYWIIPLVITTLLEGIESFEYNQMLKTDIVNYRPLRQVYRVTVFQKIFFVSIIVSLLASFFVQ